MIGCHYKFKLVFAENMTEKKIIYKPVSKRVTMENITAVGQFTKTVQENL